MTTTNAMRNRNRRTLSQGFRATFGRIDAPQAGPKSLLALGTVCLLITGAASADWRVYDDDVHKELRDEITPRIGNTNSGGSGQGSITANQKLAYDQYAFGSYKSSGEAVENPQWPGSSGGGAGGGASESNFKVENFSDMAGGVGGAGGGSMALETNIASCNKWRENQKSICEEIVKTENAQFIYMVKFHEMTAERLKRLNEIEQEREGLESKPENYGKLQDNTNKMLALNTRMALDNAQMESAMNAYEVRLAYLKAFQTQKTAEALSGKSSDGGGPFGIDLGSLGSTLVGGVALKAALEGVESDKPDDQREMDWL